MTRLNFTLEAEATGSKGLVAFSLRRAVSHLTGDQQSAVIAALCEGVSIRATERLTGVHRDTIMRLGVKVGQGCNALHGRLMVNLHVSRIELDEVWSFVKKKKKNVTDTDDGETVGDQFIYLAMDSTGKAILSWLVGKRNTRNAINFVADVRYRVLGTPKSLPMDILPTSEPWTKRFPARASMAS